MTIHSEGITEQMIEEAVKEADRRWPSPNSGLYEGLISGFKLGVRWAFENARTPTDDEREALDEKLLDRITQIIEEDISISVYAGQANITNPRGVSIKLLSAFRRSEVPEPSTDNRECGFMGCGSPRCEAMCSPEPQGEPSDAQTERARIIADLREWSRPLGNSPEEETLRLVIERIERAAGGAR